MRTELIERLISKAEKKVAPYFEELEKNAFLNQKKVLDSFRNLGISARHFSPTEGYGYDDIGRDTLDKLFAAVFHCDDALVRPQIANGTHAIFLALSGLLEPGEKMLSVTGTPYDTLEKAIGACSGFSAYNSLHRFGISLESVPLIEKDNVAAIDSESVLKTLHEDASIRMLYLQRSRGYSWRNAISISEMDRLFQEVKKLFPDIMIVVDNCYGMFTEIKEPTDIGADVVVGSLIKNAGGGIAPTGGYIAGRKDLIERISFRQTVPGAGKEVGSYAASYRPFYQGLFMAPHTVLQALKTAVLFAAALSDAGYEVMPSAESKRSDIVESIRFPESKDVIAFCRAVQSVSPIESNVVPEPWDMPGYEDQVIMAAGTFVQGATSELSADGPIRKPYTVYIQGALTYEHGKIALEEILKSL